MSRLFALWRNHPWLTSIFGLAVLATFFFAIRSVAFMIYWSDPAHHDRPIEAWMTPRFVAHSWDLTSETMQQALGDLSIVTKRRSLGDIADDMGISLDELIARIMAARDQQARSE